MSTKKEPQIEKGIEQSVSPKRDVLVVPPGAKGVESIHPAHLVEHQQQQQAEAKQDDRRGPMALDITGLVRRKKEEKKLKKQNERGDVAGKAKGPDSPPSSSSSVSLSPTEIFAYEEEQRLKANLPPLGSPKSVSPRLSPLGRGRGVGARARKKSSSSSSSSSSHSPSKSPKGRKPLTPKFEKVESKSLSPKARGKGKEGTKRQGRASASGGTRRKYKRKLRKIHSRKR
jgi:hypothetical protein